MAVGSKRFTKSYILGEVIAQSAARAGAQATHKPGLGSGAVVLEALKLGAIDVYPEYIGTIEKEILGLPTGSAPARIDAELAKMGLGVAVPARLRQRLCARYDRGARPRARASQRERPAKASGPRGRRLAGVSRPRRRLARPRYPLWAGARAARHRPWAGVLGAGHVTDIYTTDAKIAELGLTVLQDDLKYFPRYDAVMLYRLDLPARAPKAWRAIAALEGRNDNDRMIRMNGDAELRGRSFAEVARAFHEGQPSATAATTRTRIGIWEALVKPDLGRLAWQHFLLVFIPLAVAALIAIPLGAIAVSFRRLSQPIVAISGILQTIPSLALLAGVAQSAPDSMHEPIGATVCDHDDDPSTTPEVPQSFFLQT